MTNELAAQLGTYELLKQIRCGVIVRDINNGLVEITDFDMRKSIATMPMHAKSVYWPYPACDLTLADIDGVLMSRTVIDAYCARIYAKESKTNDKGGAT